MLLQQREASLFLDARFGGSRCARAPRRAILPAFVLARKPLARNLARTPLCWHRHLSIPAGMRGSPDSTQIRRRRECCVPPLHCHCPDLQRHIRAVSPSSTAAMEPTSLAADRFVLFPSLLEGRARHATPPHPHASSRIPTRAPPRSPGCPQREGEPQILSTPSCINLS